MTLSQRRALILYGLIVLFFFLFGLFVVDLPAMKERFALSEPYSLLSGLSLAGWALTLIMFFEWREKSNKIRRNILAIITLVLVVSSIIFYPPFITSIFSWNYFLWQRPNETFLYAFFTALASFQVFLLGINSKYQEKDEKRRDETVNFFLTSATLVSIASIAITFVVNPSIVSSSYQRAVATGAYCLLPIATYCLGFLAKISGLAIVEWVALFLSVLLSFIIGAVVLSVMVPNAFSFSANLPLFLIIGLTLALFEKSKGLSGEAK